MTKSAMEKLRESSLGTKLVLVGGPLLFFSLFFNWQNLRVDYGPAGIATLPQDGFDAWGLALAILAITTVTLVVLRRLTEVELAEDVPWDAITLGLGIAAFAFAGLKNLTDADSTWASYLFVGFAGVLAAGTYLIWAESREGGVSLGRRRRRRAVRPTA